jgi:hypothetical protein
MSEDDCVAESIWRRISTMATYHIEFWRGQERIFDFEGEEFTSLSMVHQHIDDLLREMVADSNRNDWTGCRFAVTERGRRVAEVPILPALSVMARRTHH